MVIGKERGNIMKEKERVILWTVTAAGLFCCELIAVTLTPLAKIGNGTRFGSPGMYYNLMMCGGSYIVPLILYCLNIRLMKYVIACVNALWLICHPVIAAICFAGVFKVASGLAEYLSCMIAAGLGIVSVAAAVLWYPMCRKSEKNERI